MNIIKDYDPDYIMTKEEADKFIDMCSNITKLIKYKVELADLYMKVFTGEENITNYQEHTNKRIEIAKKIIELEKAK